MSKASRSPRHRAVARSVVAVACAALGLLAEGCTGSPQQESSISSTHAVPTSTAPGSNHAIELACADANSSAQTGHAHHRIDGLTIEVRPDKLTGLAPASVGLQVPPGRRLFFAKAPLYLKPGTPKTTITLASASDGFLAWVPSRTWTGGRGPIDLATWMTTKVVLDGCSHRPSTYLGGMLSVDRHMCLALQISEAGGTPAALRVGSPEDC